MTSLALPLRAALNRPGPQSLGFLSWRLALPVGLLFLAASDSGARGVILTSLSDAFLQVSVFVAATLALFYGAETWLKVDLGAMMRRHRRWQVPVAALMGALPGCGGAVMVVTQYVSGNLGFGAVTAVLVATMGDAAFLLLAQQPATGLGIFALGLAVGTLSGYLVEALHGPDFLRHDPDAGQTARCRRVTPPLGGRTGILWLALLAPGLVVGVLALLQIDGDALIGAPSWISPSLLLGVTGAGLAIAIWSLEPPAGPNSITASFTGADAAGPRRGDRRDGGAMASPLVSRTARDTSFITAWVVGAFLIFELGVHYSGLDLAALFTFYAPIVPLVAVLVGLIPGCGPQIVVTSLYLAGSIPLSAQIGNAISNDGDALFPALALAPRAATLATLYSTVPAVLLAYAAYGLGL